MTKMTLGSWGFTNGGKRRTLGGGSTGGHVVVPIFESVIQAVWANVAPKAALALPSADAKRQLTCKSVDLESDGIAKGSGTAAALPDEQGCASGRWRPRFFRAHPRILTTSGRWDRTTRMASSRGLTK